MRGPVGSRIVEKGKNTTPGCEFRTFPSNEARVAIRRLRRQFE